MEAVLLPWNYITCSSKGPSPVLHPEADWCKFWGRTKLSSAELLMGNFIQSVLKTWVGDSIEEFGELVVTTIDAEEIRTMIWHPHGMAVLMQVCLMRHGTMLEGSKSLNMGWNPSRSILQ